jgi:hypothetical protein
MSGMRKKSTKYLALGPTTFFLKEVGDDDQNVQSGGDSIRSLQSLRRYAKDVVDIYNSFGGRCVPSHI